MIKALTSWPLLLCGPVLRRVGPSEVNVFVALKHSRSVELKVFQGQAIVARGTASTLALGTYLHVTVVTAVPTSTQLESGRVYAYDLMFSPDAATDPLDTDRSAKSLASPGLAMTGSLLDGTLALGFAPGRLPSFALPPAELRDLGLVHASCRKPHAPGLDALPILDTVIRGLYTDAIKRPHQLFLTGDQIYADDVAEPLLEQLSAVGRMLLGWPADEALPPRNQGGAAPTEADIAPGRRNVALAPPLTSGAAQCHLIRLAEFYAMYLFVWSDALWPDPFEKRPVPTISPETGAVHPDAVEQARLLGPNSGRERIQRTSRFSHCLRQIVGQGSAGASQCSDLHDFRRPRSHRRLVPSPRSTRGVAGQPPGHAACHERALRL